MAFFLYFPYLVIYNNEDPVWVIIVIFRTEIRHLRLRDYLRFYIGVQAGVRVGMFLPLQF
jgi:hypothetical protein